MFASPGHFPRHRSPAASRRRLHRFRRLLLETLEDRSLLAVLPPADLVSWYRAEGDGSDSADGNDATLENGATFAAGMVGQAFRFDGVDDQVQAPASGNQNPGTEITIEAWIKPDSSGHGRPILQKRSAGNVGGFTFETTHSSVSGEPENGLQFVIWRGAFANFTRLATPANALSIGQWQHVAATYDGGMMRIFVNGAEVATRDDLSGFITPTSDPLVIGRNVVIPSFAWDGLIDEVSLYSRALSQVEIQAIVDAGSAGKQAGIVVTTTADVVDAGDGVTSLREAILASNASVGVLDTISFNIPQPAADGLVSWYRGEGNASDSQGDHDGTLQNGVAFAASQHGQAFDFDGIDDSVDLGNWFDLQTFSIDLWVKPGDSQTQYANIIDNNHTGARSWEVQQLESNLNQYVWGVQDGGSPSPLFNLAPGIWSHLALTRDGASRVSSVYVNGSLVDSQTGTGDIAYDGTEFLRLARWGGGGRNWNGELDEVHIFDRALSAAEVQALATEAPSTDTGQLTIRPTSALPTITDPVIIDGYTQPGATVNTVASGFNGKLLIELNGASAGAAVGLDITAGGSTVRGLVINGFSQEAIVLRSGDGNVIEGNLLGTDATGTAALPNRGGIISYLGSDNNRIGGAAPEARNIISANLWNGIELNGVEIPGLGGGSSGNLVQNNFLGTNATGAALANGIHGVYVVNGSFGNTIGGTEHNVGNRIAFNSGAGVKVEGAASSSMVLGNAIFANGGLGIDLDSDGVTPNDPGDEDSGPNNLQNAPVILSLTSFPEELALTGSIDAAASAKYRIEFFASDDSDPSGFGEGQRLLGVRQVTTDASGHVAFNHELPPVEEGVWISATATLLISDDEPVETSEFSAAVQVIAEATADLEVTISDSPDPAVVGEPLTYTIVVTNHGPAGATGVVVIASSPSSTDFNSVMVPLGGVPSGETRSVSIVFTPQTVGSFQATASVIGGEDDPESGNNSATESTVIQPNTTIELAAASYEVSEGDGTAVLTVRRTGGLNTSASVEFTTVGGTAGQRGISIGLSRTDDFTTTSGTLFFRPRQNSATIRVPIRDDATIEGDESFRVVLSNPSANARLGAITTSTVTIHDNDPSINFAAGSSETAEGNARSKTVPINVTLSQAVIQPVTVTYTVTGGTATFRQDFTPQTGTLTFPARATTQSIPLQINGDTLFELDETVVIELSSPVGAFLGASTRHRVTINNDDPQPPPPDPGSTPATSLAIDLQTLPRQSFSHSISRTDIETFRVELRANEKLILDVDPSSLGNLLPSSTMTILADDGVTELATIGASAEPEGGRVTNNPATLFQADADGGTYFIRLATTATGKGYGYTLRFHRIGVSEEVPTPEQLNVPGPMFAWFDGVDTVGITGPTGYGFTIEGPWQQTAIQSPRTVLRSQTLTLLSGSQFTLKSPQGVELPLLANGTIVITTAWQRWGNVVGAVTTQAIDFPVSLAIAPINDLLADAIGSEFLAFGLLSGQWRISLGASVLHSGRNTVAPVDEMLSGIPYLRQKGPINFNANLGGFSLDYSVIETPIEWIFDPGDPMLYVKADKVGDIKEAALAISLHGLLEFQPQDAPHPLIDAGVTEFFGHVYATAKVPFKIGPLPMEVDAEVVINVDADRDGRLLGDLRDVDELFDILEGDFSEVREIVNDVQLGANGTLIMTLKSEKDGPFPPGEYTMEAGRASVVLDGLEETIWVRGQQGGDVLTPKFLKKLNSSSSIVTEGLISWDGDFLLATTTSYSVAGVNFEYGITISNEGIFAHVTGSASWSVDFNYGVGEVSGKAIAEIEANVAIEIDDDGDVHLSGSISASGKLRYNGNNVFSGSIEASVRSKGFRFRFPRGVGSIDLDLF